MGHSTQMSLEAYETAANAAFDKALAPRRKAFDQHLKAGHDIESKARELELQLGRLHRRRKITVELIKEIAQCRADLAKTYAAITAHEAAGPNYPD